MSTSVSGQNQQQKKSGETQMESSYSPSEGPWMTVPPRRRSRNQQGAHQARVQSKTDLDKPEPSHALMKDTSGGNNKGKEGRVNTAINVKQAITERKSNLLGSKSGTSTRRQTILPQPQLMWERGLHRSLRVFMQALTPMFENIFGLKLLRS
ncbi:hypothetical protein QJS10_CPA01g01984 [Acorus calamus]|uniref:Uncharacterized protein n=1 Tax=Acorus calamus TaxID=4465 RepID=A0AAV9FHY1_ACOCL|nr:hypothetical protein QJS10_CPA01g01984 [Acorus calamus]